MNGKEDVLQKLGETSSFVLLLFYISKISQFCLAATSSFHSLELLPSAVADEVSNALFTAERLSVNVCSVAVGERCSNMSSMLSLLRGHHWKLIDFPMTPSKEIFVKLEEFKNILGAYIKVLFTFNLSIVSK